MRASTHISQAFLCSLVDKTSLKGKDPTKKTVWAPEEQTAQQSTCGQRKVVVQQHPVPSRGAARLEDICRVTCAFRTGRCCHPLPLLVKTPRTLAGDCKASGPTPPLRADGRPD